eukprot:3227553-Pyramimonas_sp.AAC.1
MQEHGRTHRTTAERTHAHKTQRGTAEQAGARHNTQEHGSTHRSTSAAILARGHGAPDDRKSSAAFRAR